MIATLRQIWAAILTPSRADEAAYDTLVINIAHAVLGAALMTWSTRLALTAGAVRLLLPALYWLIKERRDLRHGGGLRDGLWDTAAVTLGLAYATAWWPTAALALALLAALDRKGSS